MHPVIYNHSWLIYYLSTANKKKKVIKDSVKWSQTTLDSFYKFTSNATEPDVGNSKNRDAPGSGSEWSGGESDSSEDDFLTLPDWGRPTLIITHKL